MNFDGGNIYDNLNLFLLLSYVISLTRNKTNWLLFFLSLRLSAIGKRKFDGSQHPGGDSKRRFGIGNGGPGAGPAGGNGGPGGSNWGSQPLTQQPLGTNGEQWYNDTYSSWS